MNEKIINDLQKFINFHIDYELQAYTLANRANEIGYPGFAHWFQVEAADAVVHTRRIMNYLMDRSASYHIEKVTIPKPATSDNIKDLVTMLLGLKKAALELTNLLISSARDNNDHTTAKFYDWFLIDFYEEIAYENNVLDWMKMNSAAMYELDKKMACKAEPNTLKVIEPFSPHED